MNVAGGFGKRFPRLPVAFIKRIGAEKERHVSGKELEMKRMKRRKREADP